jgi:hypothetical protein
MKQDRRIPSDLVFEETSVGKLEKEIATISIGICPCPELHIDGLPNPSTALSICPFGK